MTTLSQKDKTARATELLEKVGLKDQIKKHPNQLSGGQKQRVAIMKGIDLDFELGEFVSILGESGGGKSTLMNIIGGLDREFEGKVTIDGQVLDHKKEKQLDAYRRGTIGIKLL
ncbi:ATP-binding cassette domain-containing protein [Weissella confusa]|uniref:ATP-binding cassette domain-containing protein n=1 Tax=Weissella confusa TaxID=1583 RepID=A0A923NEH0_WEICO|nr:ATP-binding cassette domain-containing protein [Weissella confusa]